VVKDWWCLDDREPFVGGTTTGDDDARRRTRRDVDAGEGERAGGRGDGENAVVGACEIDRSMARVWRARLARGGGEWI